MSVELDTAGGPSWKPLPVVATTVLTAAGCRRPGALARVARAGGLLALRRRAPRTDCARAPARRARSPPGAAATPPAHVGEWWCFNTALGNSEGLLVAAALWAVVAHLDGRRGRRWRCCVAAVAAAAGGVAVPRPLRAAALAAGGSARRSSLALAPVPLLWFGPDVLGAGGALGASDAARGAASPQSAVYADVPALEVLADFADAGHVARARARRRAASRSAAAPPG